jgi:Fe(3+) dicitrate transport protein
VLLTLQLTPTTARARHEITLRGGYAFERSNETYLGLSDADFEADPYRRYLASSEDRMEWDRFELRLRHVADFGEVTLASTVYRHQLTRSWRKANGFAGASFNDILADPSGGVRRVFYDVMTGAENSAGSDENIVLGTNARDYVSQGAQTILEFDRETETLAHQVEFGLRVHNDYIDRDHTELSYAVADQALEEAGSPEVQTADNRGEAFAVAVHASYALNWDRLTINPGARFEYVSTTFEERVSGERLEASNIAVLPGLGIHAQLSPSWGVLAGVHRGFSSVAPGQPDDVKPEYSIAYEAGARYGRVDEDSHAEVVGFFNDFSNMTSECSFSTGCADTEVGRQFNAGEVNVFGLEMVGRHSFWLPNGWELPLSATYTFTKSSFQTAFESDDPQLGDVEFGDELPYLPRHQGRIELGLSGTNWRGSVATTLVGESSEQAGTIGEGLTTDRQVLVDLFAAYTPWRTLEVSLRVENVAGATSVASRRPFGARPVRPFQLTGGVGYDF